MNNVIRTKQIHDGAYASAWGVLWLLPNAPDDVVDAVYKVLAKRYHPDGGVEDDRAMRALNDAYRILQRRRRVAQTALDQ